MTNDDQQLILTCINALGSQMAELQKKFVWLDARNEARLATMLEKLETQMREGVLAQDIGKVYDRMEERLEQVDKEAQGRYERLLTLISVLHDAKAKQRPQPKRRKGKRPARKNGNA